VTRMLLAGIGFLSMAAQTGEALSYACNNQYYVNVSGHLVHSPSCGREPLKQTAVCRDGSVSFSATAPSQIPGAT
jgi:hypothetical protein